MPKTSGMTPEQEEAERAAMEGFPQDGDPADRTPPSPSIAPPTPSVNDPLADMRARVDRLERENADLKRLVPPATPKEPTSARSQLDEIDWDKELFANPKAAMQKAIQIAKDETTRELRSEYQRDSGTRNFWDTFYRKHPDLRDDHDLVETTLNSNLASLANIRVEDAYDKLAELTRDRILRYAGKHVRRGPKAQAEGGSGQPTTPAAPSPSKEERPTSISDFVRARRERRRAGAV